MTLEEMLAAASRDPNKAWKLAVAMARHTKQSIEINVEFYSPSPHAGRLMRLWYDPVADKEGWKFIDN